MDVSPESRVVVGIDASPGARQALDWAAEEARRRGARLLIGYASSMRPYRLPDAFRGDMAVAARQDAEKLLADSRARVSERHPALEVSGELLEEEPVAALLGLAGGADLLVVGSRGLNAFSSVMLGSVSHSLVAHAPLPVVVVREHEAGAVAPEHGEVVLGVAPDEAYGPVEFAFAQAQRRGVALVAVRSWMYPQVFPGSITVPADEAREITTRETGEVDELLAGARKAFPEVPVRIETGLGITEQALVEASKNAALVVVGSRRHRARFALPVGRVTSRVLHHAYCPVAVVPV
jgi:nucleotide-binding universal stress UspA family protein